MTLRREVINFLGLHQLYRATQAAVVSHVTIMKEKTAAFSVRVLNQMIDSSRVERRRTAPDSMDFIALLKKKLREIRAVLAGHSGDQCPLRSHCVSPLFRPPLEDATPCTRRHFSYRMALAQFYCTYRQGSYEYRFGRRFPRTFLER